MRATVAYDGTDFLGFQRQAVGRTVQATLEAALQIVAGIPAHVVAAGRTDTGVHAEGQVVHFDYAGRVPVHRLLAALDDVLPPDLAVLDCCVAAPDFHARYAALSRTYCYRFLLSDRPVPLRERYCWRLLEAPLDIEQMTAGAAAFVGEHSFRSFGEVPGSGEQQERSRARFGWRRIVFDSMLIRRGAELCFTIEANAFLTHMARSMAGTLVALGRGRLTLDQITTALARETAAAPLAPLAPPRGLCLLRVRYAGENTNDAGGSPAGTEQR